MKRILSLFAVILCCLGSAWAADQFVTFQPQEGSVALTAGKIQVDENEYPGVKRAVANLQQDMQAVCGRELQVTVGSIQQSPTIQKLIKSKVLDGKELKGKTEKFIIKVLSAAEAAKAGMPEGSLVIAGSDKRGTIYGIYELSRQLGVSPWYWWADMPIAKHDNIYLTPGQYTDGEPVVRYRGIFLNDEAPCLSNWVKEKFPDAECASADPRLARGFNHNFYEKVFELLLRLKANYLWPAMWGNAFYVDDPENGRLADEMGIMMGTSHHEPMARNHQEWARHRAENGPWDYATNQEVIDQFFREGMRRAKDNEDVITIGMRGDGDAAMGGKEGHDDEFVPDDNYYIQLYQKIFKNQRQIIKEETGKAPEKRAQIWALYKEVQRYYDLGLTVPEDVIILLCDDNWGNIRRVPTVPHKGGYGMYYHVDYVGAPRCTKWMNVTPAAHLWEQMRLCVDYDITKLWILNVGDLKPMEYPIDLFLEMAWDPAKFEEPASVYQHTESFCNWFCPEAADLLTRCTDIMGRVTPEMLNDRTYNLATGEWKQVVNEFKALEADSWRVWMNLPEASRNTYYQLIHFPILANCNLYEMYYSLALGDQAGVDYHFERDSILCADYHKLNGGKWNHLMREPHIGYRSWNGPQRNIKPIVGEQRRRPEMKKPNTPAGGYISIEAEHYSEITNSADGQWKVIPHYGRTLSAVALLPHNSSVEGASVSYQFKLPAEAKQLKVHVITNSTLPFLRREGHRYLVSIDGGEPVEVNYNSDLTEDNQWHMYDIVATRVIEKIVDLSVPQPDGKMHTLTITPVDPGLVLEKIVVDWGGYQPQHLFGTENIQLYR